MIEGPEAVSDRKATHRQTARAARASQAPDAGLAARAAALALIEAVLRSRRPFDEALADARAASGALARLAPRDRAFARLLAATTFRRLGQIDGVLATCLERPLKPARARIVDILRLGVAQILFLETPPHAAVDTAVRLARRDPEAAGRRLAGLVNAVLRRIARNRLDLLTGDLAAPQANVPDWLWASWTAAYGSDAAARMARVHVGEPPLDVTLRNPADRALWAQRLDARPLPNGSLRLRTGGRIEDLPGFSQGAWWVQDMAAALAVPLFGEMDGRLVADLCAAPGGKTAQLAAAGARVIAVDRSESRLRRLQDNLARLRLEATCVVADALDWRPPAPVDAVLVDAPCSGTGTLRRHPDIAHLKTPADVAAMTAVQHRLLQAAADMVRPGGLVIYSVCSLQPEEGAGVVDAVLAEPGGLERVAIASRECAGLNELITPEGDVRTLPCHLEEAGGMDGFFIARLRRSR